MEQIRHIDFRNLKDEFFEDIDDDDVLMKKAILHVLYEHTSPSKGEGMSEKELMEKAELCGINIIFEAGVRSGKYEVAYDEHGTPKTARLTNIGVLEAKGLIEKLGGN